MSWRPSQISGVTIISIILIVISHIHLGVEAQADCTVARNEGNATLTCKISSHTDIVQVTWQKRTGNSYDTMVTRSKRFGVKISKPYENRLKVLPTDDPKTSSIIISQLEKEDDACFTSIFNTYPDGSLKGEVCLQKLREVREVICKSTADMRVMLSPPEIQTQHSDPSGTTIQIGRWLNGATSPTCNFQLQEEARKKRSIQDDDDIFTIECSASGRQKAKITWTEEGQPISREEKVNITGDLIKVTSTQDHSLSTLPRGKGISCNVSYNHDDGITSVQDNGFDKSPPMSIWSGDRLLPDISDVAHLLDLKDHGFAKLQGDDPGFAKLQGGKFDLPQEKNVELTIMRIIIPSISLLCVLAIGAVYYFITRRKKLYSPKKHDKAEKRSLSQWNSPTSIKVGTPRTEVKQKKGSTGKKKKEKIPRNIQDSGYTRAHTDENKQGTPRTEIKQRIGSTVKKNKENGQRNIPNTLTNSDEGFYETPRSEKKQKQIQEQKMKKYKKELFNGDRIAGRPEGEELDGIRPLQ